MYTEFDKFDRLETPSLALCKPTAEAAIKDGQVTLSGGIGMLLDAKDIVLRANFNAQWELEFNYAYNCNYYPRTMYKNLEKGRYIYVTGVGFFIIDDYSRSESVKEGSRKEISCHSIEKELERVVCPLLDEGSYYFYTKDGEEGVLQKQMKLLPKWTLGFVSEDLKDKTAYFEDGDNADNAYDFLWNKIEEAYECVIDVDFITRTLSFYSLEYYAAHHKTDIHLSKSNDLKQVVVESKDDDCFTAIDVKQDDNLSLVYSNPNGSETLYRFDAVLEDMTPELQAAVGKWQEKYEASILPYRALSKQWCLALDELSNLEEDLSILKDELNNLKTEKEGTIAAEQTEASKKIYLDELNKRIKAKEAAIKAKEEAIAAKKADVKEKYEDPLNEYAKACSLDLTAKDVDGNAIFTQELLNELSAYINSAEYSDEYITQTDDMKYAEICEQSNKLFDRAKKELVKLSTQSYTFSVTNNSFLFNKKFERFSKQLCPGAIVHLETSDDTMEEVHLTNFAIDYGAKSVKLTFGNKYERNDIKSLFQDVFGNIKASAKQVKYLKNIVNDQRSEIEKQRDWIDNALTLTKDHFLCSANQSVIIDDGGYLGRQLKTDKDGNVIVDIDNNPLFSPEQLGIINNTLAITKDNWQSVATAIGKIYLYHDEETDEDVFDYGVAGSIILGQMFVGKTLSLLGSPRDDGTYAITLNENGLTIINDGTTAGITIKDAAGNKQFYADADGNLILSGGINSTFGKVGGWTINNHKIYAGGTDGLKTAAVQVPADGSYYVFAAGGENHDNYGDCPFRVGKDGKLFATDAEIKGKVTATSGSFTGSVYASDGSFNGKVTASEGKIGGWVISNNKIYGGGTDGLKTAAVQVPTDHSGTVFAAGGANHADYSDCPFRVDKYGNLYATSAEIKGKVTATSGSFNGSVYATSGTFNGTVYANSGNIGGCDIVDGKLYVGQWTFNDFNRLLGHESGRTAVIGVLGCGSSELMGEWTWADVGRASFSSSDFRLKRDIADIGAPYDNFFDGLKPKSFIFNSDFEAGKTNNVHLGFIAQDVKESLEEAGLQQACGDSLVWEDMGYYHLSKPEFIALNTWQIQKLKAKVSELEKKLEAALEGKATS